ncbi:Glycerate dehydrogenase [Halomonadaceae bacterium LMG 33818]|uniref:D-2-hydroxyacid dehydrogenase family protein n=1 Tax=Cernens ardua TaxID=3402176 RepID=UPI003EDC954D
MKISVLDDYQNVAHQFAEWSRIGADIEFLHTSFENDDDLVAAVHEADVLVVMRERTPFNAERLKRLSNLKLLVTTGMRNAAIDLAAATEQGICVTGTSSLASAPVEHTWALILALLRHIPQEDAAMRKGQWQTTMGGDLAGQTLGIVGLGRLGLKVAAIGKAFGMNVVAWSQNLEPEYAEREGILAVDKATLFSTSDVVTLHYKLSERSTGLVGEEELLLMKTSAILVNTSRGPLIDNAALEKVLKYKLIRGAALDVYDIEPLPAGHPLRHMKNTVITPHLGYVTENTYRRFYSEVVEDIIAWIEGKPIRCLNQKNGQ